MYQKKQHIGFSLSKIAALLFYLPFFLVQVFTNHESNFIHKDAGLFCKKSPLHKSVTIQPDRNKTGGKLVSIRLNKRFQPATIPFCVPVSFEIPVCIVHIKLFGTCPDPFITSFYLHSKTLRGPPAVA